LECIHWIVLSFAGVVFPKNGMSDQAPATKLASPVAEQLAAEIGLSETR
jgi:hypothetical protein